MSDKLEQYLLERGINIHESKLDPKITESDEKLANIAGTWASGNEEIKMVIRARMAQIRERIIVNALPVEVPVLRQALVELAGVIEDFEKYTAEFEERQKRS